MLGLTTQLKLDVIVIRADGTKEDFGTVGTYNKVENNEYDAVNPGQE